MSNEHGKLRHTLFFGILIACVVYLVLWFINYVIPAGEWVLGL